MVQPFRQMKTLTALIRVFKNRNTRYAATMNAILQLAKKLICRNINPCGDIRYTTILAS